MTQSTSQTQPSRRTMERSFSKFYGLDLGSTDSAIRAGFGRYRDNVDLLEEGVQKVPDCKAVTIATATPQQGPYCTLHLTGKIWGFYYRAAAIYAVNITDAGSPIIVTSALYDAADRVRLIPGKDRVYIERPLTGGTLEAIYNPIAGTWGIRTLGITPPAMTTYSAGAGAIEGYHQYGVEYVEIDAVSGIVLRSSGVNRIINGTVGAVYPVIGSASAHNNTISVNSTTTDYTHIRLWRSKRTDPDPAAGGIIAGDITQLYLAQTITKAVWEASLVGGIGDFVDNITDANLESLGGGGLPTTVNDLDLLPLVSMYYIGVVGANQVFGGGLTGDPAGVYPGAGRYAVRYMGSYNPADRINIVSKGDIKGIYGFGEDLVVRTDGGLWRLPNADIDTPFISVSDVPLPATQHAILPIEGAGIFILSQDKALGYVSPDYIWKDSLPGRAGISSEDLLDGETVTNLRLAYAGGKICITGITGATWGKGCLALDWSKGWVRYGDRAVDVFAVWDSPYGYPTLVEATRYCIIGHPVPAGSQYTALIDIGPIQSGEIGYGIVEMAEVVIEGFPAYGATVYADIASPIDYSTRRRLDQVPVGASRVPGDFNYVYQLADRSPLPTGLFGPRLFLGIGVGSVEGDRITQVVVKGFEQLGGLSEARHAASVEAEDVTLLADLQKGIVMRFTRPDPLSDFYGNGDLVG